MLLPFKQFVRSITSIFKSAGVLIGNGCWALDCLEHGIQPDWQMRSATKEGGDNVLKALFSETGIVKHVLSLVFLELGPAMVEIGAGAYRQLFYPAKQAIINHSDCIFIVDSEALCGPCRGALDIKG
jgi:hypothetical protein